jgi:hypothetical protein
MDQARRLHLDGEHEPALFLLARLLELAPLNPEAAKLSSECRGALERHAPGEAGSADSGNPRSGWARGQLRSRPWALLGRARGVTPGRDAAWLARSNRVCQSAVKRAWFRG